MSPRSLSIFLTSRTDDLFPLSSLEAAPPRDSSRVEGRAVPTVPRSMSSPAASAMRRSKRPAAIDSAGSRDAVLRDALDCEPAGLRSATAGLFGKGNATWSWSERRAAEPT